MSTNRELRALLALARAQQSSRSARVRFRDTERTTAERLVDVFALSFEPAQAAGAGRAEPAGPRWLVAVWSAERASLRVLDLARVLRVRGTRRKAGEPPAAFDALYFAQRAWFDPGAGSPRVVTVHLDPPWDSVPAALLPTGEVAPGEERGALVRIRTSRPDVVGALAASLLPMGAVDSTSHPWPKRRRSLTRRASSASPPGSSRREPR